MLEHPVVVCGRCGLAPVAVDFERSHERCYESFVVERCTSCGRRLTAVGVLWETAPQEADDGA